MAVSDSDAKSRAILEKQTKKGEEYMGFQEAQGQLMNIQAERQANLNQQRALGNMEMQNNQLIAQAAGILAASGGGAAGGMAMAAPQRGPNSTQGILNKFGIGKPGTKSSVTTQTSNSPQKIQITNNNTTTNNIQVSQPQIPMQAPVIPMRTPGGDNTDKFKVWVSNAFAKQNEAAAIRDKEYQKREWSLTRSANKMIRKMGELGKAFAEKMNPKNVSNMFGDQLKVVMWLMGFQLVVNNIGNILKFVENLSGSFESLRKWFTGDGEVKSFGDFFTKLFGGKVGVDSAGGSFKKLAEDVVDAVKIKFDEMSEKRGAAIKAIPKPDIDLTKDGLGGIANKLLTYLGDVISVGITGSGGLQKAIMNRARVQAHSDSLEEWSGIQAQRSKLNHNTDTGDYAVFNNKNHKMISTDFGLNGLIKDNKGTSYKYSNMLNNYLTSTGSGSVNTMETAEGFRQLYEQAARSGDNGTLVSSEFLNNLGGMLGVSESVNKLISTGQLKKRKVRLIEVPKSEEEFARQGSSLVHSKSADDFLTGMGVGGAAGGIVGGLIGGPLGFFIGAGTGGWLGSEVGKYSGLIRRANEADNVFKLVDEDDPRYPHSKYPTVRDFDGKQLKKDAYSLTDKIMDKLASDSKISGFSWDMTQKPEQLRLLEGLMLNQREKMNSAAGISSSGSSDLTDIENQLGKIDEVKQIEIGASVAAKSRMDKLTNLNSAYSNIKELGIHAGAAFDDFMSELGVIQGWKYKKITKAESKNNAKYVTTRLMNELGLTKTQAAGIVGNLIAESGMNPQATNPSGAEGIAQWLGDRKSIFIYGKDRKGNSYSWNGLGKSPNTATLKEQTDFLIWELRNTHNLAISELKKIKDGDYEAAAKIGLGRFEFSGGYDSALEEFRKHGNQNPHLDVRYSGAKQVLEEIMDDNEISGTEVYLDDLGGNNKIFTDEARNVADAQILEKFKTDENGDRFIYDNFKYLGITENEFKEYKKKWKDQLNKNPRAKITESDIWKEKVRTYKGKKKDGSDSYSSIVNSAQSNLATPTLQQSLTTEEAYELLNAEEDAVVDLIKEMGYDYNPYEDKLRKLFESRKSVTTGSTSISGYTGPVLTTYSKDIIDKVLSNPMDLIRNNSQLKGKIGDAMEKAKASGDESAWWGYLHDSIKDEYLKHAYSSSADEETINASMQDLRNYYDFQFNKGAVDRKIKQSNHEVLTKYNNALFNWNEKTGAAKTLENLFGEQSGYNIDGSIKWNESIVNKIIDFARNNPNSEIEKYLYKHFSKRFKYKYTDMIGLPLPDWKLNGIKNELIVDYSGLKQDLINLPNEEMKIQILKSYEQSKLGIEATEEDRRATQATMSAFTKDIWDNQSGLEGFKDEESLSNYLKNGLEVNGKVVDEKANKLLTALRHRVGVTDATPEQLASFMFKGFSGESGLEDKVRNSEIFKKKKEQIKTNILAIDKINDKTKTKNVFQVKLGSGGNIVIRNWKNEGEETTIKDVQDALTQAASDGVIKPEEINAAQLDLLAALIDIAREIKNDTTSQQHLGLAQLAAMADTAKNTTIANALVSAGYGNGTTEAVNQSNE